MCQLVLRHERDLNCLHQQNTFILFNVDGEGRPDDPDTATKQQLETVATTAPSDSVPTTMPGAQCDADSGSKGHKSDGMQEGGSTVSIESSKQVDTTGCIMALPQVGPQVEILGGRYEDEQPSNEGPTADVGTDLQAPGKTRSGREVPCQLLLNLRTRAKKCQWCHGGWNST